MRWPAMGGRWGQARPASFQAVAAARRAVLAGVAVWAVMMPAAAAMSTRRALATVIMVRSPAGSRSDGVSRAVSWAMALSCQRRRSPARPGECASTARASMPAWSARP